MYRQPTSTPLPYAMFKQRVRRYPRSALLRRLAATSVVLERARFGRGAKPASSVVQSFTVAGIARTCLAAANEYRSEPVTDEVVERLCHDFVQVDDPDMGTGSSDQLSRMMSRIVYEQFGVQYSQMENLARTVALFTDHAVGVADAPRPADWVALLGVDLHQFMRVGFAAYTAMMSNGGSVAREVLLSAHVAPIFAPLTSPQAMDVLDAHFVWTLEQHAAWARAKEMRHHEKWSPNPLQARPLVAIGNDFVAPGAHYIIERITPTGLYYLAADAWGGRFTTALGATFERYIEAQLRLLPTAIVYPEIVYASPERKSCDLFMVFDEVVVLVEVKAARPTIAVRSGQDGSDEDLRKKLGHARDQIVTSAQLVRSGHPDFARIPADRPLVGLIITLEPFHLRQTFQAESVIHSNDIPITAACAHDLEDTVASLMASPDAGQLLLAELAGTDAGHRALRNSAPTLPDARNPILDACYERWAAWPHRAEG